MKKWWVLAGVVVTGVVAWVAMGPLDENPMLLRWFGPGATEMREAYDRAGGVYDHGQLDAVLRRVVRDGKVDYRSLKADPSALIAYNEALAEVDFDGLSRDEKLALLINAYNSFTLQLILEHYPIASIKDIPAAERWDAVRWNIGGRTLSLGQIENDELRTHFVEPRIHFAINCASVGCPPLRAFAYDGSKIDEQLADSTQRMHDDPTWLRVIQNSALSYDTVELTRLYLWYEADFRQTADTPLAFAAHYRPELADGDWTIRWLEYDWSLNER